MPIHKLTTIDQVSLVPKICQQASLVPAICQTCSVNQHRSPSTISERHSEQIMALTGLGKSGTAESIGQVHPVTISGSKDFTNLILATLGPELSSLKDLLGLLMKHGFAQYWMRNCASRAANMKHYPYVSTGQNLIDISICPACYGWLFRNHE